MKYIEKTKIYSILIVLGLLLFWQLMVKVLNIPALTLPSPTDIISAIIGQRAVLFEHGLASCLAVIEGFIVGGAIGIILGVILMYFEVLNKALMPILVFFQTMPKVAIAPLVMVWFGLGNLSKVILASTIVFFYGHDQHHGWIANSTGIR